MSEAEDRPRRGADGRFQKGASGNPRGRPSGRKSRSSTSVSAFDIVIDKSLTVTQDGVQREMTVEEALQHKTYQEAIAGSRTAQRKVLKMIAKREKYLAAQEGKRFPKVTMTHEQDPENADNALLILGIASRDPARQDLGLEREQLQLEPWAVQAALRRRRGGQRLTDDEMASIRRCTRDPDTIKWPRGSDK